jgi:hypothetical protein
MQMYVGDGITYSAELFRVAGNTYRRLEREGHGYIVERVNDELIYVFNGVRTALVHKKDIIINHRSKESRFDEA